MILRTEYRIVPEEDEEIHVSENEDGVWIKQGGETILLNHEDVIKALADTLTKYPESQ